MVLRVLVLLTSFLVPCVYAQSGFDVFHSAGSIKVRVTPGEGACDIRASVLLVNAAGAHIAEDLTNTDCEVYFVNVSAGSYHVAVSGTAIESTDSGRFDLDSRGRQEIAITVKRVGDSRQNGAITAVRPTVAAVDLNIPRSARREFDKATQFVAKQDWQKAVERLNKAIAIYPHYAEAYNNLGVVYGHLGDRARNLEALQKAISLNDHFVPAYLNLARMAIADRDFPLAESLMDRTVALEPNNFQTLVLLANTELLNQHYDQALANSRRVHSTAQGPHAVAHYVAARVFEYEGRPTEAVDELQVFLSEEPPGPRADIARKEMNTLQERSAAIKAAH